MKTSLVTVLLLLVAMLWILVVTKAYQRILAWIIRRILSLRYKIQVTGLENISGQGNLILPNHPASIDPVIVATHLWKKARVRPVISETYYKLPGVNQLMKLIGAIPMPDLLKESGQWKKRRMEKSLLRISQALENGDSVLFYPAGKLKTGPREIIGGAFGTKVILENAPHANVFLARTNGLYGSSFSTALSGGVSPDFGTRAKEALGIIFKNLLFFIPKRKVTLKFEPAPADFTRSATVTALNNWLEEYYNQGSEESLNLVPYFFWKNEPATTSDTGEAVDISKIPAEVVTKVLRQLSEMSRIPLEEIKLEHKLTENLGLDSLYQIELMSWLDQEFEIVDVDGSDIRTVGSLINIVAGHKPELNEKNKLSASSQNWKTSFMKHAPELAAGHTIVEKFLNTCDRLGNAQAVADDRTGILSWKKLKISILVMAREIQNMPGEKMAIMLPASVGATITTISTILAGKVPVMLNWTMGKVNMEHALKISGAEVILTSEAFLDRINADISFLEDKFVFLEEIRSSIGLSKKIKALWQSQKSARKILSEFKHPDCNCGNYCEQTAVILFTSGSESAPKGVPLSHRNILSNIESMKNIIPLSKEDVFYGFLPLFHSFGLTVTTIFPLVTGIRTVFHPNPTESRKLADGCAKWGISLMCGTPTFLSSVLNSGPAEKFATIRLMVSGAEKAPDSLFEKIRNINHGMQLLEGYGITECSPVVSSTRVDKERIGVGEIVPGVEVSIVDLENMRLLPDGERGLILIKGDNVFSGYLGNSSNPFVDFRGSKWYNSGDLGIMKNGHLILAGRLKRFIKIGGEMISLPAIEDALKLKLPNREDGPVLAISAKENNNGTRPEIILFSTVEIDTRGANDILRKGGFPPLVSIKSVMRVENIPLLGSGKTDYKALSAML